MIGALAASLLSATGMSDDGPPLDWLEGCWEGEGLGGEVVECWMQSPDGHWSGMFQMSINGRLTFSEFFQLADFQSGRELRLLHFDREMATWEAEGEFTHFPFVEATCDSLIFDGMSYRLLSPDQMRVEVVLQADGEETIGVFNFTRR